MKITFTLLVIILSITTNAQTILGTWKTIDDETGNTKSVVSIYENEGRIYGEITQILTKNKNAICSKCKGDKKNKPILGLKIIEGLRKNADVYEDGTITNPENGKVYKCRLKLEDENTLQVRGYVAFFYKTQYWKPVD